MTLDPNAALYTLSTISQTIATILAISLGIFTFTLTHYSKNMSLRRNMPKRRKAFTVILLITTLISILVAYFFMFPSQEFFWIIWIIFIMLLSTGIIIYNVIMNKNLQFIGMAITVLSSISFIATLFIGSYAIFLIFSKIILIPNLEDYHIWEVIRLGRLFVTLLLISSMYLAGFISYHKVYLESE